MSFATRTTCGGDAIMSSSSSSSSAAPAKASLGLSSSLPTSSSTGAGLRKTVSKTIHQQQSGSGNHHSCTSASSWRGSKPASHALLLRKSSPNLGGSSLSSLSSSSRAAMWLVLVVLAAWTTTLIAYHTKRRSNPPDFSYIRWAEQLEQVEEKLALARLQPHQVQSPQKSQSTTTALSLPQRQLLRRATITRRLQAHNNNNNNSNNQNNSNDKNKDVALPPNSHRSDGLPRWEGPMSLQPILDYLREPTSIFTRDQEKLFLSIDKAGVSVSKRVLQVMAGGDNAMTPRVAPLLQVLQVAHRIFTESPDRQTQWPHLYQALLEGGDGFPMLTRLHDDCTQKDHGDVPTFTLCARLSEPRAIPFPNYEMVWHTKKTHEWQRYFQTSDALYPWHDKIRQVVWRGSLTGNPDELLGLPEPQITLPRWRLCRLVHSLQNTKAADYFNIGLVHVGPPFDEQMADHLPQVGGLKDRLPGDAYQRYTAVLDVDGNTWSSRFSVLLCTNSVVLKVEPKYVDYYYPTIRAWEHYIPVRADLSDLVTQTEWALDPAHEPEIRAMIAKARLWCAQNMVVEDLGRDMVDIWEWYTRTLTETDPQWQKTWQTHKPALQERYIIRKTHPVHAPEEEEEEENENDDDSDENNDNDDEDNDENNNGDDENATETKEVGAADADGEAAVQ